MTIRLSFSGSFSSLLRLIAVSFLLVLAQNAPAEALDRECTLVSRTCAQTGAEGCERYESTYRCVTPNPAAGACSRLASENGCTTGAASCTRTEAGVCLARETPLTCPIRVNATADARLSAPEILREEHTSTRREGTAPAAPGCRLVESTCTDSAPRQVVYSNAADLFTEVAGVCWEKHETYSCQTAPETGTSFACTMLEAAGCTVKDSVHCTAQAADGTCTAWGATYACKSPVAGTGVSDAGTVPGEPDTVLSEWDATACTALERDIRATGADCRIETECLEADPATGVCLKAEKRFTCEKKTAGNCEALKPLASDSACGRPAALSASALMPRFAGAADDVLLCLTAGTALPEPGPVPKGAPALLTESRLLDNWTYSGTRKASAAGIDVSTLCAPETRVCSGVPGWRLLDGVLTYRTCWEETVTRRCVATGDTECAALEKEGCRFLRTSCPADDPACPNPTRVYECREPASTTALGTRCDGEDCVGDLCRPSAALEDPELVNGLVQLEIARELAAYGDISADQFFRGEALHCRDRAGTTSCCRLETRESTSNAAFGQAVIFAGQAVKEGIKYVGSPYVYDALSWSKHTEGMLRRLYGNAKSGAYSPSFSYWGLTATYVPATGWSFSFSPSGFLASAAMTAYSHWSACTAEDAKVSLARGERLCHYVGERCVKKTPGLGCTERQEVYVCFNSRLAKIITTAARDQLGIGWGTPDAPIARGLTMAELELLDFSRIDFSDFVLDVINEAGKAGPPDVNAAAKEAAARIRAMVSGEISRWAPTRRPAGTVPSVPEPHHPRGAAPVPTGN